MSTTEETNAAAYLKLHEDVKQLVISILCTELRENYGGELHNEIKSRFIYASEMEQRVKDIVKNQMLKY